MFSISNLGKEQENILIWWYRQQSDKTFSPGEGYKEYREEKDYTGEEATFNNLLLELHNKGLLDKPKRGKYRLSDKGANKADYIINPDDYNRLTEDNLSFKQKIKDYFIQYKEDEYIKCVKDHQDYELELSELEKFNPDLVDDLETAPLAFKEAADKAAEEASPLKYTPRIIPVFDVEHFELPIFKARSGEHIGNVVTVEGTIETTSNIHNVCSEIEYECRECGELIVKEQYGDQKRRPYKCDCGSKEFKTLKERYDDRVEFTVGVQKEQNENIKCVFETEGITQRAKKVFQPGNKVRISGRLDVEDKSEKRNRFADPYIYVIGFEQLDKIKTLESFSEDRVEEVRKKVEHRNNPFEDFAQSIAPQIVESDKAKQVIAASLLGGSSSNDDGRIHSLILSNPGMGKTDMMEFVENTFPNSHYADGKNSSGVGLTATVEQEQGGVWRLKAGKLVYADQGLLSIDEFDKMDHEDTERLNTAMVKPTFPVDKAGVNAELPGQATVIAAGNFEEYLEGDNEYIQEYIPDHAESLLDRFSLVYALKDGGDSEKREDAILSRFGEGSTVEEDCFFDREELVIYRELARQIDPILTEVSQEFIKSWLNGQKSIGESKEESGFNKDSNRYLVSLAKLTTMFARSRLAERTNERDAQRAIELVQMCRESRGLDDGESDLNVLEGERKQNRVEIVRSTLQDLQEDNGDGVFPEEIADNCPLDVSEVDEILDELEAEIMEPSKGKVKLL